MRQSDFIIAVAVGAIIAIQSVALAAFRHGTSTSEKYTPRWYQRSFFFVLGAGIFGWGLYHLLRP
jgi:hypothetical protein